MPPGLIHYLPLRKHLRVVHHVPGRIRLRVRRPKAGTPVEPAQMEAFLAHVQALPAIRAVRLSPVTYSAVIEYDRHLLPPALWSTIVSGSDDAARDALVRLAAAAPTKD